MSEVDILTTAIVILVGWVAVTVFPAAFDGGERRLIALAYLAHLGSVTVHVWLVTEVYGIGDMLAYMRYGEDLANGMGEDFTAVFPEVLKVIVQQPHTLSIFVPTPGSPAATMCGLTSLCILLLGPSIVPVSMVFATAAFLGKLTLYVGLRHLFPARFHRWLVVGTLLVPSAVFWSAGVIKEAVAMAGLGPAFYGMVRISKGARSGWIPLLAGALVILLVKPYILMAFAGAGGVAYYWMRSIRNDRVEIRPVTLLVSAAAATVGILLVAELFPRYALDGLADEAARMQAAAFSGRGGSNYVIGDPRTRTFAGQLLYTPMGLVTALFRPFIIEARNPMMLANGVETTLLLGATVWVFVRNRITHIGRSFVRYPGLAFCLAFVVLLGIPVGLTAANLGTLSRYRVPIVPFQVVLLLVFASSAPRPAREPAEGLAAPSKETP